MRPRGAMGQALATRIRRWRPSRCGKTAGPSRAAALITQIRSPTRPCASAARPCRRHVCHRRRASPEPIIQSTWTRLVLAPSAASSALGALRAVEDVLGIGLADRDVAGGVLVEQRVVEEHAALGDRRGVRHQRHLAEPAPRPHRWNQAAEASSPLAAVISTMRPRSKRTAMPSISEPW